jgi:hypothetical protein
MPILLQTGVQVFDIGSRSEIVEHELCGGLEWNPDQNNDGHAKSVP